MDNKSTERVNIMKQEGSISVCPVCKYSAGFHVSFNILDKTKRTEVILICPSCHEHFTLGWEVLLKELK